ncbi:MAG: hypothetical protein AMXMBFR47_00090 [Planctomycetota bacterium]
MIPVWSNSFQAITIPGQAFTATIAKDSASRLGLSIELSTYSFDIAVTVPPFGLGVPHSGQRTGLARRS